MASACGIHIDQRRYRLIVLDGSAKKHKIVAHASGEVPPGEDPETTIGSALRAVARKNKLRGENVGLVVSSGLAAFRRLTLPFDDRAKIEEVIKFEVESDLPQWNIDDVIVDFLVTDSKPGVQSNLLVTAIPKEHLGPKLAACEKAGLEAGEAELDGAALFDVARETGVLSETSAQVLVFVGDASTTVVVADGGRLASMRAIRAGAQPVDRAPEPPLAEAGEGEAEATEEGDVLAPIVVPDAQRLARTIHRIRRELTRTISGAQPANPIEGVYVCGRELPGFLEQEIEGVPVAPLEALPTAEGIPDAPEMMVAYGAALHQLGGGTLRPRLRRENLRFTGKFERLELPLAVLMLLLLTLFAVRFIVVDQQIKWREQELQAWLKASNTYMLPSTVRNWVEAPARPYPGRLKDCPQEIVEYCRKAEQNEDPDRTKFEQIDRIRQLLRGEIIRKETELGQTKEFPQPLSALRGLTLVLGAFDDLGAQVGRVGLRGVTATYRPGRGNIDDEVVVKLDIDFLAQDTRTATEHFTNLNEAIAAEPWCIEFEEESTKPIEGDRGISVEGMTIHVDPRLAPEE